MSMKDEQNCGQAVKMCPYCEQGESNEFLLQQRDEAFGDKNALYMDASIWMNRESHISVGVCLFGNDIMMARFPISYCPMCGRKLMEGRNMDGYTNNATANSGPHTFEDFKQIADFLNSKGDSRTPQEELMVQTMQSRLDSIAGELVDAAIKYNADVMEHGLVDASDTPVLLILASLHTLSVLGYQVNAKFDEDMYTSIEIAGKVYPVKEG